MDAPIKATRELNSMKISRAGVIPYTLIENDLYFLLSQDRRTNELGDFGGGCKEKERVIDSLIREFREESSCVFGREAYNETLFQDKYAIIGKTMLLVFLPITDK